MEDNKIITERRQKLHALRLQGIAFPNDFRPTHQAADLHAQYRHLSREDLEKTPIRVSVAGRMMLKRMMGKATFATLQDGSGTNTHGRLQIFLTREVIGEEAYEAFRHHDLGDIFGAVGTLFKTKTDELSVRIETLRLLTKSLRALPDKFHGLADQETRYRQRYIDLIMNEDTHRTFKIRSALMSVIRHFMVQHDFLEVETPMLHPIPGGAAARPFKTHHNALDMPMFMRIAPELYLKRLIVGGFSRVFEINRNFRNEGISPRHNPEFTMMEFYAAYTDYQWMMNFTECMIRQVAMEIYKTTQLSYQERPLDLEAPFERLSILQAIQKYAPHYATDDLTNVVFLKKVLAELGIEYRQNAGLGALQLALFEETTEAQLWSPTFIVDYPLEVSPLARACDSDPLITERFELFITGKEIANGFSELNDPEDQAARFALQMAAKEAGDEEAMYYDADYIRALEYGMPPTGGCGIGIDRLAMIIANATNIRDVILFPHLKKLPE